MKAMTPIHRLFALLAAGFMAAAAHAQVPAFPAFPAGFRTQNIRVDGETGDMWAPMAADLMRDHTVVVPDLRG